MADKTWPGDDDGFKDDFLEEPDSLGGLWGKEDPDEVEVELYPISDEEFAADTAREEEEKDGR